uniref:Ariadne domain-containing protein n=1 Tax=Trieres chinensis TaxID=1514140 RepID=A0A7S1Z2U4_TRICV
MEKGKSNIEMAQAELDRYLHCYNRFHSHAVGQTFSEDQLRKFIRDLEDRKEECEKPEERVFKNSLEQLIECRRVLKYSYAVMYYMKDGSVGKTLFEDHQKMLESFTERLSGLTEKRFVEIDQKDLMNLTGAVKQFVKNVLAGGPY